MTSSFALQPIGPTADRRALQELEARLSERETALDTVKRELLALQARYLEKIGPLYAELSELEAAIAEAEVPAGLAPPSTDDQGAADGMSDDDQPDAAFACSSRSAPSDDLKRMFRDLAKTIHPDLALDEPARCRRHSLMAEANRAYAERDEDRLRLILRAWQSSPESVSGDDPEAERRRTDRRSAEIEQRLAMIDVEFNELGGSAIHRLKQKIDDARRQGWDLFAEMILQVRREIARARATLASTERQAAETAR